MQTESKKVLTISEVANILRISTVKAYQMAKNQEFPVIKIGRCFRIPADAFNRWFDHNDVN